MKLLILLALVYIASSSPMTQTNSDNDEWDNYKQKHGKFYNLEDDAARKEIFIQNTKAHKEHNDRFDKGEVSFKVGPNKFTDMVCQK